MGVNYSNGTLFKSPRRTIVLNNSCRFDLLTPKDRFYRMSGRGCVKKTIKKILYSILNEKIFFDPTFRKIKGSPGAPPSSRTHIFRGGPDGPRTSPSTHSVLTRSDASPVRSACTPSESGIGRDLTDATSLSLTVAPARPSCRLGADSRRRCHRDDR